MKKGLLLSVVALASIAGFMIYQSLKIRSPYSEREEEGLPGALRAMDLWGDMRLYPFNNFRAAGYSAALEMSKRMSYASRTKRGMRLAGGNTTPWVDLAPKNFAGRVLSMAIHPTNPNIMWVGSASGGLWKTTNGGTGDPNGINWQYVTTGFPVLGVSSMVITPDGNTIYIGTGEIYQDPQSSLGTGVTGSGHNRTFRGTYGIGILKSTDGGNTWSKSLDFSGSHANAVAVMDMAMDPNNSSILYAATTNGIYRTTNAGGNWSLISITGTPRLAMDLEYRPSSSTVLYASFGNFGSAGSGIYKTSDANATAPTFTRLTAGLPATITGKIELAVTPAAPNNVYASVGHSPATGTIEDPEGFYRSTNEGASWSGPAASNIIGQQGWYAHDIAVSRTNADTIYWGEMDLYRSNNGTASAVSFGIQSSWSSWNVNDTIVGTLREGLTNSYVHADIHRIIPSPHNNNTIFILTDGGVFRSTDRGQTFQTLNGGLQTAQIYASAAVSSTDPNFMLMGMQDNEGLVYVGRPGCRRVPNLGDGFHAAISPSNHNTCYIASYNLKVLKSTDKAATFTATTTLPGFGDYNGDITACFNAPFVLAPSSPSTVYGGTALLRKSTDALGTVSIIGGTTTSYVSGLYSPILTMAVSHQNANRMYCSTTPSTKGTFIRSKLWRTVTTANAFTEKTDITGTLPDRYYTDIAVDPTNDQRIVVTLSGFGSSHLFLSLDGGNNWTDIGQGLPDIPHNSVVFDPNNRDIIYVGNDQGVYYARGVPLAGTPGATFNLNWISYNEGLGDGVLVSDIVITNTRKLRLATYGRGLWERDMVTPLSTTAFSINNATQCISGNSFQFTATSSTCTGTLSYQWNFGNGNTATGATATQSYTAAGTYPVKLVVSNTTGCIDSITQNVTVTSLPNVTISPSTNPSICTGDSVTLSVPAATGDTYQWRNGTTNITGATSNTFFAKTAGTYSVVVTTSTGCSATSAGRTVTLLPLPTATETTISPSTNPSICPGSTVTLSVPATTGYTYQWRNGNTNITGATSNSYVVNAAGTYSVIVITASGCSVTSASRTVTNATCITTPTINTLYACAGTNISVSFTASGFTTGNVFTAQLSNASGSFTTPVTIGTRTAITGGTITGIIPATTVAGSGYKVRITATTPALTSSISTQTLRINRAITDTIRLCAITIDSIQNKNVLLWNKPANTQTDSFFIYRKSINSSGYTNVAKQGFSAMSRWTDISWDPERSSTNYYITGKNICGETAPSTIHTTIHLSISKGINDNTWNLIWNGYEGFPVSFYNIWRGSSASNMTLLTTTQARSFNSFTDNTAPTGTVFYRITNGEQPLCTPTGMRLMSNMASNQRASVIEAKWADMSVYPNPSTSHTKILVQSNRAGEQFTLRVIDNIGRVVWREELEAGKPKLFGHQLVPGIYILQATNGTQTVRRRWIKQ